MTNEPNPRLSLPRDEMERVGRRVLSMIIDHLDGLGEASTGRTAPPSELKHLRESLPEDPTPVDELLETLRESVFSNTLQSQHPRFFAWVPGPSNYLSVLCDALSSGYNVFAGTWLEASGPAEIERVTIQWLCELIGFSEGAGGVFVSGGSAANLMGLGMARQVKSVSSDLGVAYCSDQTHSSVARAFRFLNIQHVRQLPTDEVGRLIPELLDDAIERDRAQGLNPFLLVSNLGTTNTGAVDPLGALQDICGSHGMWHHADGAYGGGALLSDGTQELARGVDRIDSITIDPHKWLFQPYECAVLLVRERPMLDQCFYTRPEYLTDTAAGDGEINYGEVGLQLTRRFRALKLWLSLKSFGASAFRLAVERGFQLASLAQGEVEKDPDLNLESPAQMGILCFRYLPHDGSPSEEDLDSLQLSIASDLFADGFAVVHTTVLRGRRVLRMCTINPRTTDEDIRQTFERIKFFGKRRSGEASDVKASR